MAYSKNDEDKHLNNLTTAKKRRIRKKKSRLLRIQSDDHDTSQPAITKQQNIKHKSSSNNLQKIFKKLNAQTEKISPDIEPVVDQNISKCVGSRASEIKDTYSTNMSSKETPSKSREEILAEREAKKLAKLNAKLKTKPQKTNPAPEKITTVQPDSDASIKISEEKSKGLVKVSSPPKGKDEVDKATVKGIDVSITLDAGDTSKEQIKADRAAKKLAKQAKKKGTEVDTEKSSVEITNKAIAETLSNIVEVAKDVQEVTAKQGEEGKSKAELKAERRAKQEAQRAAKQAQAPAKPSAKLEAKPAGDLDKTTKTVIKEKSPKPKSIDKPKAKSQIAHGVNWFQHLYTEQGKDALKKPMLNSNLHPAIIKLGVQLRSRVVSGSNARCIALLDALKKMVRDYSLPARTEFARGLEAHLAASLAHVWAQRPPAAAMTNAVKYFRYHLTQLSNNVSDFEAKKILQGEIDRYIREQIDMAGEAISIAVRNKISSGDTILTYGCSSLIERILVEAHCAGLTFRAVVAGGRVSRAREMLRRLAAAGVPCQHVDLAAVSHVMKDVNKVVLGAGSLLANGSVLGAVGTCQVALAARRHNLPVLVCCETHKFSERVQTDAFVYNELGDPDDLIAGFEDSPLKEWRSNPNLTLLNLTYDVTPPSLVTAVVTELAILPCTSAPVVLRFKLSEYAV